MIIGINLKILFRLNVSSCLTFCPMWHSFEHPLLSTAQPLCSENILYNVVSKTGGSVPPHSQCPLHSAVGATFHPMDAQSSLFTPAPVFFTLTAMCARCKPCIILLVFRRLVLSVLEVGWGWGVLV